MEKLLFSHSFWSMMIDLCDRSLLYQSRIHRLPMLDTALAGIWVKREDESGFGISGPKRRKYASLLPFIAQSEFPLLGLIGGAHSNHLVGIAQLLNERQIPYQVFLKAHSGLLQGNHWLLDLLTLPTQRTLLPALPWPEAQTWAQAQLTAQAPGAWLVPEGGTCPAAVPGLMTLGYELLQQEAAQGWAFGHIWIDAGTGGMAAALAAALGLLGHPGQLHVVLTAGDAAAFAAVQAMTRSALEAQGLPASAPQAASPRLHRPFTAKSFGSVNSSIRQQVRQLARQTGMLCDPVYTAKLFGTMQAVISRESLAGQHLVVHTGGGTGLMGFAGQW